MAFEFKRIGRVQFVDTDLAGIVHFSRFFHYMESTEHAFYRSLGFRIHSPDAHPAYGFPRIHVACRFRAPLYFEDEVETQLLVREVALRTISYVFYFRRCLSDSKPIVARGEATIACVAIEEGRVKMKGVPIPGVLSELLEAAPEELFLA